MTPAEIKQARQTLGLSAAQMAPLLGYGAPSRIYEIESSRKAGAAVVLLLRAYLDGWRWADWPMVGDKMESPNTSDHPRCATCNHFRPAKEAGDFGECRLIRNLRELCGNGPGEPPNEATIRPEYKGHAAAAEYELEPLPRFYCAMHSDLMPGLSRRSVWHPDVHV